MSAIFGFLIQYRKSNSDEAEPAVWPVFGQGVDQNFTCERRKGFDNIHAPRLPREKLNLELNSAHVYRSRKLRKLGGDDDDDRKAQSIKLTKLCAVWKRFL